MIMKSVYPTTHQLEIRLREVFDHVFLDEPLSKHTTFRVGGPSDFFCIARKSEQLVSAVRICQDADVPYFILGGGSNILVSDAGIRGVTIKNETQSLSLEGETIFVDSGYFMPKLATATADQGLTGAEFMQAIPGTIGGGVFQNARFRHPEDFGRYEGFAAARDIFVGELVESITVLTPTGAINQLANKDCKFVYDRFYHSGLNNKMVIISTRLKLNRNASDVIRKRMRMYLQYRNRRGAQIANGRESEQPLDPYTHSRPGQPTGPSAGCVFYNVPNPWDHPTGRMIDMCGLKGKRVGEAQISDKHANYIVNLGNAKAADIRNLIEDAKSAVFDKFGVELVCEIELIGEW